MVHLSRRRGRPLSSERALRRPTRDEVTWPVRPRGSSPSARLARVAEVALRDARRTRPATSVATSGRRSPRRSRTSSTSPRGSGGTSSSRSDGPSRRRRRSRRRSRRPLHRPPHADPRRSGRTRFLHRDASPRRPWPGAGPLRHRVRGRCIERTCGRPPSRLARRPRSAALDARHVRGGVVDARDASASSRERRPSLSETNRRRADRRSAAGTSCPDRERDASAAGCTRRTISLPRP